MVARWQTRLWPGAAVATLGATADLSLARRRPQGAEHSGLLAGLVYLTAIHGGYFGAAQSVIFIALLAIFVPDDLRRVDAEPNAASAPRTDGYHGAGKGGPRRTDRRQANGWRDHRAHPAR